MAGLLEKSIDRAFNLFLKGVSKNKLLFIFAVWYAWGFILYSVHASGLKDWRLMVAPILILLGICFSFAFMQDNNCHRIFIILFIIFSGVQAIFSVSVLASSVNIARQMYVLTSGAWIYGNQTIYAIYVTVLPVLIYQAVKETGLLRLALFIFCCLILIESLLSSFGTPLGLLLVGVATISLLALILLFRTKNKFRVLLITGTIIVLVVLGYKYTYGNPLFASAYDRVITALKDPSSGGYAPGSGGTSRVLIDEMSIKSFIASPIFGVGGRPSNNPLIGGHSSLVDSLGTYGLLGGGGALCGIIAIIFGSAVVQFWRRRDWETLLAFTTVILLVVVGIVNPYWQPALPFVFIIVYPSLSSSRKKSSSVLENTLLPSTNLSTSRQVRAPNKEIS